MNTQSEIYFLVMLMAILCMSCQSNSSHGDGTKGASGPVVLEDLDWRLVELRSKPVSPTPAGERPAQIRFSALDKQVAGFSGLNQFTGSYELESRMLRLGPLAMTRRAGPPALMQLESDFTRALGATVFWRPSGRDVELIDSSGEVSARLTPMKP